MAAEVATPYYIASRYDDAGNFRGFDLNLTSYSNFLKDHFHIVYFNKTIYIYDKEFHVYRAANNEIQTHLRDTVVEYGIGGTLRQLQQELMIHVTSMGGYMEYPFNRDTEKIPVLNGVIKISYETGTVEFLPHSGEHMLTYKLQVNYNPDSPSGLADALFKQWVDEDYAAVLVQAPSQALLQMQFGYAYKKAYLLQGDYNAGKTSYITLLRRFFGKDVTASTSLHEICEDRFSSAGMEGKLLNIFDELQDVPLNTIEPFKALTGGCDHRIHNKYLKPYDGRIAAVHVFSCNYPPAYPEKIRRDPAFWKRWEYVKFPNTFPQNSDFYKTTFTDEFLSSFLNSIIAMMIQIKQDGLLFDSDVQKTMGLWNINSDPMYDFLNWGFFSGDGKTIGRYSKVKLHNAYLIYCRDNSIPEHKRKLTLTAFTRSLQPHGFLPVQHREKAVSYEVYETTQYQLNRNTIPELDYHEDVPVLGIPIANAETLGV
jgi:phage/plasmid-associated DNA primase